MLIRIYCKTIQNQKFNSEKLKKHYQTLFEGNHNAHQGFKDLAHILSAFDQRANIIILFAGNLFISRDLHLIIRFNKWQNNYETLINQWIETIAELDALCSFANFSYNNPEYIFPEIQENTPISATELAHPLIVATPCWFCRTVLLKIFFCQIYLGTHNRNILCCKRILHFNILQVKF